jgi:hypothetical protein
LARDLGGADLFCQRYLLSLVSVFLTRLLASFGTSIASMRLMTDENYTALLLWTICVLTFACGVVALTQHPEWFGA